MGYHSKSPWGGAHIWTSWRRGRRLVDSGVQYSNSIVPGDSEVEAKCYMWHSYFMQLRAVTLSILQESGQANVNG